MAELAEKYFKKLEEDEAKSNIEKRIQGQVLWVAQLLANGAKDAHRYTNKPNQKNADIHYDGIQLPDDVAAKVREIWALEWEVDNEERKAQAREAMDKLTEELKGLPTDKLRNMVTRESLLRAAKSFKNGTAIGADQISFQEIANLPKEGLDEMVDLIRDIIRIGEWPDQAMTNVVALLGKKCGGTRCICICTTLYRVTMTILKSEIRKWDIENGSANDSALRGKKPKVETAKRAALVEMKAKLDYKIVLALWDVQKLFDNLDIPTLIL